MAEEQNKTVDVALAPEVKEEAPLAVPEDAPAAESSAAPAEEQPAEDKPAEDAKPAETTEEAEGAKEEVKPIDEGHLSHKAQGAGFPKNLISSKAFFSFGSEALGAEALAAYKKAEKHAETAYHNIAWAAHSGNGLLFIGDKKAPSGVINLADATEPELDGSKGFHITSRGNKHTFKASSVAERDGWVAKLKEKIPEAKELVATITESDIYKQTIESFKPAAPAKEDKPEEAAEEAPKADEPAETEEGPKEEGAAAGDLKVDEAKDKRRSASRKRASFFGFGKKEDKEEAKQDEPAAGSSEAPAIETVAEAEAPATEDIPATESTAEAQPADETSPESPKEKVNKRNSFFGNVFSKKEKKAPEASKTEESPKEEAETTDTAPVIPPVEATTPLAVDVSSPVAAPAETVESPVVSSEPKKDVKEKRKSSLPFAFGKREKSPAPAADGESKSAFSKLRATIKGKGAAKSEEKPVEESAKEDEAAKEEAEPAADAPASEEAPKTEEAEAPSEETPAAPAVTAAA